MYKMQQVYRVKLDKFTRRIEFQSKRETKSKIVNEERRREIFLDFFEKFQFLFNLVKR